MNFSTFQTRPHVGFAWILATVVNAVSAGVVFEDGYKLLGLNASVAAGLAYAASNITSSVYIQNSNVVCARLCTLQLETCYAFNFVIPASSGDGLLGMCELIGDRNVDTAKLRTHNSGQSSTFLVRMPLEIPRTDFVVIPALEETSAPPAPPLGVWPSDCSALGGSQGMLVAIRNFGDNSFVMEDFKCRMFRSGPADGGLRLDPAVSPTVLDWRSAPNVTSSIGQDAKFAQCPPGAVITGIQSVNTAFQTPSKRRCHQLALPWFVNTTNCRNIIVYRYDVNDRVSPLNDVYRNGTAESVWGAQCGSQIALEAMTGISLHAINWNPGRQDYYKCCRINSVGIAGN